MYGGGKSRKGAGRWKWGGSPVGPADKEKETAIKKCSKRSKDGVLNPQKTGRNRESKAVYKDEGVKVHQQRT